MATDDTGAASTSTYDEMGRIATITDPDTGTVSHVYDENGNITATIDPLGNITHSTYDVVNRRFRVEDPELGVRQTAYDAQDNPIQVIGARGFPISFTYDLLGQQTGQTDALGASWSKTFDALGNLVTETDAKSQTKTRAYDAANRLLSITAKRADATVADVVSFTYDAAGNILTARDNDSSLAWSYDALNRTATASTVVEATAETTTVQPAVTLTNVYDAVGDRRQVEAASGLTALGTTFYDYDPDGLLARVITPAGGIIDLGYDSLGRQTNVTWPSSASAGLTYGPSYERPEEILHAFGTTALARFAYGYDIDGRMLSVTGPGGTRNFTYDRKQQLTGAGFVAAPESYTYDKEGNRITSHRSASYAYDDANRLTEDTTVCYGYDANGNLTSKRVKIGLDCVSDVSGAVTTYSWDTFDRLTRIDFPNATYSAYRYDMQGQRIEKDVNGVITRYVYDRDNIVLEFDGAGALAARYSHGEEIDRPLAMERGGASYTYHADERGSVRLITDGAGSIVSRYDYDAFGNLEATSFEGVANPFAFTGREWDAESGLYFYRARYYDPKVGRFVSQDPLGLAAGDFTLYGYVFNNPMNWDDPTGMLIGAAGSACFSTAGGLATGGFFGGIVSTILAHVIVGIESEAGTDAKTVLQDTAMVAAEFIGTELVLSAAGGCNSRIPKRRALTRACSFRGDMLVKTRDGFTAIRDVRAGEQSVWSRNARTGQMGWKPVLAQYSNAYDETVHVTVRDLEDGEQTIISNRIHPFFVQVPQATGLSRLASTGTDSAAPRSSEGHDYQGPIADGHWIDAADLKPGYRLLNDDESWAEVVSVEIEKKALNAYNLTVADFQTYFVKEAANDDAQPVWVHNVCNIFRTAKETADAAARFGYTRRIPAQKAPFNSHGQTVFYNPKNKTYISRDITAHNTIGWKLHNRKGRRTGTYDVDLNRIKD